MKEKVKSCPFCGGDSYVEYQSYGWGGNETLGYIRCSKCGMQTKKINVSYGEQELREEINRWNTRTHKDGYC